MPLGDIGVHYQLDDAGRAPIISAMNQLQISACDYHRVLRLGRTIADLTGSEGIQRAYLYAGLVGCGNWLHPGEIHRCCGRCFFLI